MKAFLLIASLSFASAIMLVPHDGNETRPSIHDAVVPENFTGKSVSKHFVNPLNFTNDVNTKHRPHLAIVETRKLFENEDNDENYSDGDDDGNRRLLRHSKAAAARPKVAAAPPKAAPAPVAVVKSGPASVPIAAPVPEPVVLVCVTS